MTLEEYRDHVNAFPGEYRLAFAIERAKIYRRIDSAENYEGPYNDLVRLLLHAIKNLGFKDSLTRAITNELVWHSMNLERYETALRYQTIDNIISFRDMNQDRARKLNYWAGEEPLITIQDEVKAYYRKNGTELEKLVADGWEPAQASRNLD